MAEWILYKMVTPHQTTTLTKWMFIQKLFFKSSLLLNGQCSIQVRPLTLQRRPLPSLMYLSFFLGANGPALLQTEKGRFYKEWPMVVEPYNNLILIMKYFLGSPHGMTLVTLTSNTKNKFLGQRGHPAHSKHFKIKTQ